MTKNVRFYTNQKYEMIKFNSFYINHNYEIFKNLHFYIFQVSILTSVRYKKNSFKF